MLLTLAEHMLKGDVWPPLLKPLGGNSSCASLVLKALGSADLYILKALASRSFNNILHPPMKSYIYMCYSFLVACRPTLCFVHFVQVMRSQLA